MRHAALILALAGVSLPAPLSANDGAAVVAAGGVRLRKEGAVRMVDEKLFISPSRIRVDYIFLNTSDREIVTEVAFPVPEYDAKGQEHIYRPFDDFSVRVDGRPRRFRIQAEAWADGKDVTALLRKAGLDVATFGRIKFDAVTGRYRCQVQGLPRAVRKRLQAAGAVSETAPYPPLWSVRKTYHWTMRFPPGREVRVFHAYRPVMGWKGGTLPKDLDSSNPADHPGAAPEPPCPTPAFRSWLEGRLRARTAEERAFAGDHFPCYCVRYILTTANTWQTPIENFQLDVEAGKNQKATFCWKGPILEPAPGLLRATARNFMPDGELTVYFAQP